MSGCRTFPACTDNGFLLFIRSVPQCTPQGGRCQKHDSQYRAVCKETGEKNQKQQIKEELRQDRLQKKESEKLLKIQQKQEVRLEKRGKRLQKWETWKQQFLERFQKSEDIVDEEVSDETLPDAAAGDGTLPEETVENEALPAESREEDPDDPHI